ncbi:uncharacterized protein DS421_1g13360 [Arachis hypogaea]|nr:uncharacterized protein DS421_1g13360 [Arachis hypogaea]
MGSETLLNRQARVALMKSCADCDACVHGTCACLWPILQCARERLVRINRQIGVYHSPLLFPTHGSTSSLDANHSRAISRLRYVLTSIISIILPSLTTWWRRAPSSSSDAAAARREHYDRTKSAALSALKGLKFIAKGGGGGGGGGGAGWHEVEKQFDVLTASTDGWLHRSLFGKCIGISKESEAFSGVLFGSLARRRDIHGDSINKAKLKDFWDQISDQSFDSRLRTFFNMVDKDANGRITEEEIKEIICLSATTNKLSNIQQQAEEYAALIMEKLDPEETRFIMLDSLEMLLLYGPSHSTRGDSKYLCQMLSLKLKPTYEDSAVYLPTNPYTIEGEKMYPVMGYCVCMAKGAAETLKLNMAIILLPVCRNTITWMRNKTKLGIMVPFDDNLNFHKVIDVAVAIHVGIHAIFHLSCDFPRLLRATPQTYKPHLSSGEIGLSFLNHSTV